MPLYEFRCRRCDHRFELLCSFSQDEKDVQCPSCHVRDATRCMSTFSARSAATSSGDSARSIGGSKCGSCSATRCGTCSG